MGKEKLLVFPRLEPDYMEVLSHEYDALYLEAALELEKRPPESLRDIRAVLTTGPLGFTTEMFEACPGVECVVSFGAGIDRIDMITAARRGVTIATGGNSNAGAVAEHAMALSLALVREIPSLNARVAAGGWRHGGVLNQISGRRLGLLGLGAVGKRIARMADGFGMEIAYTTRRALPQLPFRYFFDVRDLAAFADILVLACPGGSDTHHLVGHDALSALGEGGYLVNVARGSVVHTGALIQAIEGRKIAGAALDVFDNEPLVPAEFCRSERVILTPHVGGNSRESRARMFNRAQENLSAFFSGRPLPGAVLESAV